MTTTDPAPPSTTPATAPAAAAAHNPAADPCHQAWRALLAEVHAHLQHVAAHPARSVVLLPYAQMLPVAARCWAAQFPNAFAPRFETTRTWAAREGHFTPEPHDVSQDLGRDLLTAASLLPQQGLPAAQRRQLDAALAAQAAQLAQAAASLPPAMRPDWMERARTALPPITAKGHPLALEALIAHTALAWAGNSNYASDVLFSERVRQSLDALITVPGLLPDALTDHLHEHFREKAHQIHLAPPTGTGSIRLHACHGMEDEAQRAAACVLAHINERRTPVALASGDRALLRRTAALLATRGVRQGVHLHDETGWRLSTTHSAALLMAALTASGAHASSADALGWLKLAPAFSHSACRQLEELLRSQGIGTWQGAVRTMQGRPDSPAAKLVQQAEDLRQPMQAKRSLIDWLHACRTLLHGCGLWDVLAQDDAGATVLATLGLADAALPAFANLPAASLRMSLHGFTRWAADALEAASYRPARTGQPLVLVLPLNQIMGRAFGALVLPGADAQHLPVAPDPPGTWTQQQRKVLGLPTRKQLQDAQQRAWRLALGIAHVDVLWRMQDAGGEAVQPSPLVQALQIQPPPGMQPAIDPRTPRTLHAAAVPPPAPTAADLPTQPVSASAYGMLRQCPYRYFALRLLRLDAKGDLDTSADKRDWGNWVHHALHHFHESLQSHPQADRHKLMQQAAEAASQSLGAGMEPAEFLPFTAAWPALRDSYLQWLEKYEAAEGAQFATAEHSAQANIGRVTLHGQIDRIDHLPAHGRMLIDYKTESQDKTKKRLQPDSEDVQLPFYALLHGGGNGGGNAPAPTRAAYLNLQERKPVTLHELGDLHERAAQLADGLRHDFDRIAQGQPLPALGEGNICGWCDARGLCRKDWQPPTSTTPATPDAHQAGGQTGAA